MSGDDATVLRANSRTNGKAGTGEAAPTPRVLKSRFVLDEKLGAGGMGTVYRAKDLRKVEARDRFPYVAIKVLNSDVREHPEAFIALEREASKSQQLSHTNIVSIFDFDKDGNVPFITMELLQGRELADLLHAYPNGLPEALAWEVIAGLCAGLRHAHENGVVHADFKPGNVFVTSQDVAKILDFGIARAVQVRPDQGEDSVFDPARMAALTPVYASLEMIRGDNPEFRDDLYSLGVVIYMVLTGHHPYGRLAADEALAEGLAPERPKQLNMRQWRGLSQALSFHRQGRPADVAELQQALLGKVQWRSRAIAAAALTLAVFTGSFAVLEGAQIDEVKEEVRQTTLLDAQAARMAALVVDADFSEQWMNSVSVEMGRLRSLDYDQTYAPGLTEQVVARINEGLSEAASWQEAVPLYELAQKFGTGRASEEHLRNNLQRDATALVSHILMSVDGVGDSHRKAVDALLALRQQADQVAPHLAAQIGVNEVGVTLGDEALRVAERGDLTLANDLLALAEPLAPQADRLMALHTIAEAEAARSLNEQREAQANEEMKLAQQQLNGSCLRLQVSSISTPTYPAVRGYVDAKLAECIDRLAAVDPEQARAIQREALVRLGDLPAVAGISLDPCIRENRCQDPLSVGLGPELVVVSDPSGHPKYAVTQEISGRDFAEFCATTELDCSEIDMALPVVGLAPQIVERFAAWLSTATGYQYRLPRVEEWAEFGDAASTGTVNCGGGLFKAKRLGTPTSGRPDERGLHHVLGNAAELVKAEAGYQAIGGSVRDGGECSARVDLDQISGVPVGFRLLRELS